MNIGITLGPIWTCLTTNLIQFWYNDKVQRGEEFNFQKEMELYCRSDVDILRRGCGEFRKVFIEQGGVCPF